jgi:hypothetical protein
MLSLVNTSRGRPISMWTSVSCEASHSPDFSTCQQPSVRHRRPLPAEIHSIRAQPDVFADVAIASFLWLLVRAAGQEVM